jgi:CheY-like chemotaxis protein
MLEIVPGIFSPHEPKVGPESRRRMNNAYQLLETLCLTKVLVVDDEKLIADTLTEILKRHGFETVAAYSGEHALQIAAGFHPDYLLADVLMPFMNGVDLAIAIRKMSVATRILLFSDHANSSEPLDEARLKDHNFDVVAKPIHPEKLVKLLEENR